MKKMVTILLIFSLFSFVEKGNKIEDVLIQFQKEYAKKSISMDFEMYYVTHKKTKAEYEKGEIHIGKSSYYSKRNEIVRFFDAHYNLVVNMKQKTIRASKSSNKFFNQGKVIQIDSLASDIRKMDNLSYSSNSTSHIISLVEDDHSCQYIFSKSVYTLDRVVFTFKEDVDYKSLVVNFSNVKFGLKDNKIKNSYKDFVKSKKGNLMGVNEYKSYKII